MKIFEVYGNLGKLLATIEAEDENDAFDQVEGVYTTQTLIVEA